MEEILKEGISEGFLDKITTFDESLLWLMPTIGKGQTQPRSLFWQISRFKG
jgi:hypothetical protein